ncbi:MAG: rod shape-determining protein RodA [Bacillota bacterium]
MRKPVSLFRRIDWILILSVLGLCLFGLLIYAGIHTSSLQEALRSDLVRRQATWIGISFAVMIITAAVDYRWLRSLALPLYLAMVGSLAAVMSFGVVAGGARRWLLIGSQTVQPSEFAKIVVMVTIAHQLTRRDVEDEDNPRTWMDLLWAVVHVGIPAVLVLAQPDLGTALVFAAILFGELYITGFSPWRLLAVVAAALLAAGGAIVANLRYGIDVPFLRPHMVNRLVSFVDPSLDPTGAGYQLQQSLIAIGSGQVFGNGLFRGSAAPLTFLPEQHTDFVFSSLAEQTGFVGTSVLLVMFLVLLLRMLSTAAASDDAFGAALVTGAVGMLFFHILVNVGMTLGLMPVTGLPLPFISYGRSALFADMVAIGLTINVRIRSGDATGLSFNKSYTSSI